MAKILIVEDEEPILHSYSLVLTKQGHEVVAVNNAPAGLEAAQKQPFDLILLDLLMPEVSGIDFLRRLNPHKTIPGTRIVVLTNTESPKIISEAMELGASQYLLKVENTPYDIADKIESFIKI
jgi:CheY-like chemotaxis protein